MRLHASLYGVGCEAVPVLPFAKTKKDHIPEQDGRFLPILGIVDLPLLLRERPRGLPMIKSDHAYASTIMITVMPDICRSMFLVA